MSLTVKSTGNGDFKPVEEGVYIGTVCSVIDVGDQFSEKYGNSSRNVMIVWELDLTVEVNGEFKPRQISKEYNASLNEKANLRKMLESFRGKKFSAEELDGFSLTNILGKSCQIQVTNTAKGDKTYANISAVMSLPKGVKAPPLVSPMVSFDLDDKDALAKIDTLPKWIVDKIKSSETYKDISGSKMVSINANDDPDLPF